MLENRATLVSCACDTNSLIVHSRSKLVNVYLLYDGIYSVRILITSFRWFWYKYQIHKNKVQVLIGSATPPVGQVRFKSYCRLSTSCTFAVIRQVTELWKNTLLSLALVYVTQSSLKRAFTWHVTCRASGNFAFVCPSFIAEMKSNKDTSYKPTNCRPDFILERVDIWCRFSKKLLFRGKNLT